MYVGKFNHILSIATVPPELNRNSKESDLWCVGMCCYYYATGSYPYHDYNECFGKFKVRQSKNMSEKTYKTIRKCLSFQPSSRLGVY